MSKETDTQLERHPEFPGEPYLPPGVVLPPGTVFPPPPPSLPPMYGLDEGAMRRRSTAPLPTPWRACVSLRALDLAGLCDGDVRGFSVHSGVLVCWDSDHDERVLQWLAELPESVRELLRAAYEHEGTLTLVWRRGCSIPPAYADGKTVSAPGDVWTINVSVREPEMVEALPAVGDDFYWPDAHSLGVFDIEHATKPDSRIQRAVWMGSYWVLPGGNGSCSTARLISHGYVGVQRKSGQESRCGE
jgi:hypothetical protein